MEDETPEREMESTATTTTIPTDLTITESTISSSDLVPSPLIPKRRTSKATENGSNVPHAKFSVKEKSGKHVDAHTHDGGDRRHSLRQSLEDKYNDLLLEVNEIRVNQVAEVSTLESELKLKSFELKRLHQHCKSVQSQLKANVKEKAEACAKVKCLDDELRSSRRGSDLEICNLTMALHEKTVVVIRIPLSPTVILRPGLSWGWLIMMWRWGYRDGGVTVGLA